MPTPSDPPSGPAPSVSGPGRGTVFLAALVSLLALLSLASVVVLHLHARGYLPWAWQKRPLTDVRPEQGFAYVADLHQEWMSGHEGPSPALVLEDGVPLGPGNALHQQVRDGGQGQFSFWHSAVLFSASDNSDPRTNRKRYEIYWPAPVPRKVCAALPAAAAVLSFLGGLLAVTVLLPLARDRFAPARARMGWLRDRLLGNPSFAVAAAVFAAALALQLVNFGLHFRDPAMARTGFSVLGVPFTDALEWHNQGASLASGQGMSSRFPAMRPGYGLFLALFYTWAGPSYLLAVALNLVLTALSAGLLCRVGEILVSRRAGVLAALGFATQELTLTYPLTMGTESVGLFGSVLFLHQLLLGIDTGKRRFFLSAGVIFGLSNLVRPLTLPAFPLYLLGIVCCLWPSLPRRAVLARAAVFSGGLFLALAPWLLRQWLVFGIATISDNSAEALYAATSPRYGSWTGRIYREADFKPMGVKDSYDYFMSKARANLRDYPGFYAHNVTSSFAACFGRLSASARPHLPVLGLFVILGCFLSRGTRYGTVWRAGSCALALGLVALAFLLACDKGGAAVDLAFLLLLPLVARPGPALVHVLGLLGSVLGVALFGMGEPDRRLLFMLEWGFLLSSLAFLDGCSARVAARLEAPGPAGEPSPSAGVVAPAVAGRLPRWFLILRAAAVGFVVVSGARLAVLTATTTVPPDDPHFLSGPQALQVLRAFDRHAPGLLGEADFRPDQVLSRVGRMDRELIDEIERSFADSHNKVLVLPIRLFDYPYYLPENVALPHWSRYFSARDYDRTVCYFQLGGVPTPKSSPCYVPVLFPGFVPRCLYGRDAVLICRVTFDLAHRATDEAVLFEGTALIPTDETGRLRLDEAYFATHPHHPGTNPQLATCR